MVRQLEYLCEDMGFATRIAMTIDSALVMSGSRDMNGQHVDVSAERNSSGNHRLLTSLEEDDLDPSKMIIVSLSVYGNGKLMYLVQKTETLSTNS